LDNVGKNKGRYFFPLIFAMFLYILCLNLFGLVPSSFTLSSHLVVTFALSLFVFLGINIICIQTHGIKFFSLFLPQNTPVLLAFLLVPIELISYIFKPVSLSIRLFANMMGGHTLLKIIAGFAWTMMGFTGTLFVFHYIPLLILIPLFALEAGIALIQSFVFSILICIYVGDGINLH
jgi:ATP synthase subunit 6